MVSAFAACQRLVLGQVKVSEKSNEIVAIPAQHRGGGLSAVYLFAYLSLGIVAFVLGVVATQRGLGLAVDLDAAVITLFSLATIGLLATQQLHDGSVPAAPFSGGDRGKSAQASIRLKGAVGVGGMQNADLRAAAPDHPASDIYADHGAARRNPALEQHEQ
jgi:hypothetical protein